MLNLSSGQHGLKPKKNSISETCRKFAEEWKPLTAAGQHNSMGCFFFVCPYQKGARPLGADFSSDSNSNPPSQAPQSMEQRFRQSEGNGPFPDKWS